MLKFGKIALKAFVSSRKKPLVSVGIPTFNRPELLGKAIQSLAQQDYDNLEVIIGDNSDQNIAKQVNQVCLNYKEGFANFNYTNHPCNIGATNNFFFVFEQALGKYFMWMPDDYQILDKNYISKLVGEIEQNILIFPLFVLSHLGGNESKKFFSIYESLQDTNQYLEAWLSNGSGHPFYGLYNRSKLQHSGYFTLLKKCSNWTYFGEGLFLHRLFLDGNIKYCSSARMFVDSSSSDLGSISQEDLIRAFCKYTIETARMFENSSLEKNQKEKKFDIILKIYSDFFVSQLVK